MDFPAGFRLDGKVAIITGASKGIGEAIAEAYVAAGAAVVVNSRKPEAVKAVADRLGERALAVAGNAGDSADLQRLVAAACDHFGGVDIVVNNAATNPVFGPVENTDTRAFDKIMQVNVRGPFELAKMALPLMRERGGGSIINVSSIGGLSPEHHLGIYSVSKAALLSLTKVMAREWGPYHIRVNAICPGLIQTRFSKALWSNDQVLQQMMQQLPLQRIGQPAEIAGLALFLAAPASSYCTGGVFTADGGHTI